MIDDYQELIQLGRPKGETTSHARNRRFRYQPYIDLFGESSSTDTAK